MQQKYPFLIELVTRLKLKSPSFFAKLQAFLFSLAGIFELCALLKDVAGVNFPDVIEGYINHGTALVTGMMGAIAALPVENKVHLEAKIEEKLEEKKS